MKLIVVQLVFRATDDADPDQFGEDVLCAVEQSPWFSTAIDGTLVLRHNAEEGPTEADPSVLIPSPREDAENLP